MKLGKRLPVLLAACAVLAFAVNDASAQVINREAEFKGKMVGILVKQVTWPNSKAPTTAKPLTIGILGDNPFVDSQGVNHLQQRLAGTGAVILTFPDETAYRECHVLVVANNANFEKALAKTKGEPVLVISETPGLAKQGAAINLVFDRDKNQIRLEINPATALKAKLQINRDLLLSKLVDIVN